MWKKECIKTTLTDKGQTLKIHSNGDLFFGEISTPTRCLIQDTELFFFQEKESVLQMRPSCHPLLTIVP